MTSRRTLTILYSLHSWAGIIVGLWVFVVSVTGALLVFKAELDLWANPSLVHMPRVAVPAGPDAVLHSLSQKRPDAQPLLLRLPSSANPSWFVNTGAGAGAPREKLVARADTGEVLSPVDSELGQFIRNIHVFLLFGPRWPVGFLGVVVLFLIGSGVIIHRKVFAQLFTLRWGRSLRVVTADAHRTLGIWGLIFHVLIAFTGAWLGLAPVFERAYRVVAGAEESPAREIASPETAAAAAPAGPAPGARSVDALLARAEHDVPGLQVETILLERWGTPQASVRLAGHIAGELSSTLRVTYEATSGALLMREGALGDGALAAIERLMEPLHYGNFGGVILKWLYFALGLGQAALALSGSLIWFERSKLRWREALIRPARSPSHV